MSKSTALVFILFFGIILGLEQPVSLSVCVCACVSRCTCEIVCVQVRVYIVIKGKWSVDV